MEKEDLGKSILGIDEFLADGLEQINKDISYNTDLMQIAKKHNKIVEMNKKEQLLEELNIRKDTIENIINNFNDVLDENDVDIEEVKKYCNK